MALSSPLPLPLLLPLLLSLLLSLLSLLSLPLSVEGQLPSCPHPQDTYLIVRVHRSTTPLIHCTDFWDDPDTYVDVKVRGKKSKMIEKDKENEADVELDPNSVVVTERKQRTNRVDNHMKPQWKSTLDFGCVPRESSISFEILDYDTLSDQDTCLGPLVVQAGNWPEVNEDTEICNDDNDCLEYSLLYTDTDRDTDKDKDKDKDSKSNNTEKEEEGEGEGKGKGNKDQKQQDRRSDTDIDPNPNPNQTETKGASSSKNNNPTEELEEEKEQKAGNIGIAMAAVGGILVVAAVLVIAVIKRKQKNERADQMLSNLGAPNDEDGVDPEDVTL